MIDVTNHKISKDEPKPVKVVARYYGTNGENFVLVEPFIPLFGGGRRHACYRVSPCTDPKIATGGMLVDWYINPNWIR